MAGNILLNFQFLISSFSNHPHLARKSVHQFFRRADLLWDNAKIGGDHKGYGRVAAPFIMECFQAGNGKGVFHIIPCPSR